MSFNNPRIKNAPFFAQSFNKDSFVSLPEVTDDRAYLIDGIPYGLQVHEKGTDGGAEADLITYRDPDGADDDFYLFYGSASVHVEGNEKAVDNAAAEVAARLLALIDPSQQKGGV